MLGEPHGIRIPVALPREERLLSATASLASAQVAFDLTLEFVQQRRAFGRPIGTFQNSRFKMADMRTQLDAMQSFLDAAVLEHNEGSSLHRWPPKSNCSLPSWRTGSSTNACSCTVPPVT